MVNGIDKAFVVVQESVLLKPLLHFLKFCWIFIGKKVSEELSKGQIKKIKAQSN